jgi:predicted amidohydrolase YtcJ
VLEQDLFKIEEDAIPNVGVSMTVVDETIMFEKNKESSEF